MATPGQPKVSVCVVTYNHERYISNCLASVLSQETNFDFEVIVGDDCSTDGTSAIVDGIAADDSRVRVSRPARNVGPTQNLLAVHNAARGQYIASLDGDDLAEPSKLAKLASALDQRPELALCGHRMRFIDEAGVATGAQYPAHLPPRFDLGKLIRCGMPVLASSIMYRAGARTLRSVDFEIFDWYLYGDVLTCGDGGYIPEDLGAYRINRSSLTSSLAFAGMQARMLGLYTRRYADWPERRADMFAWAAFSALASLKNRVPVSARHWRFLRDTFAPLAVGELADTGVWTLQNRHALAR
jgi:glycosyltransferase involved in cell wall biosynthesis